jgi:Flp pilus assembly CpaE family ATPase
MLRFIHESGFPADKIKLVVNRVARRNGISLEDVESVLGIPVFAAVPNDYGSLEQAYAHGRLLPEGHRVRNVIKDLTERLTGLTGAHPRKKFNLFGL